MTESDPNGTPAGEPGAKLDAGKTLAWLCISGFARALQKVAEVTTKGAQKYSKNGWKSVPDGSERYMDAFARHALALGSGEVIDPGTGCMHKAQMIWNLLASLELDLAAVPMTAAEVLERKKERIEASSEKCAEVRVK